MNVLLITQHFEILGGSDVMVHQTKRLLEAEGHTVHIFAARAAGEFDDGVYPSSEHFENPSPATLWKFLYSPQARKRLSSFLDSHHIDVAHLHIHYGTLTSSIIKPLWKRGIRIVQHLHEYRTFCSVYTAERDGGSCQSCSVGNYMPSVIYRCNRGSILRSIVSASEMYVADSLGAKSGPACFLTVSNFQRDMLIEQGLEPERIHTLYNPVDPIFFDTVPLPVAERQGVVFVGRVESYKGVFDFIEVAGNFRNIPFTIIGEGGALAAVKRIVLERGLLNVQILGKRDRSSILGCLRTHRVMLVPSRWNETFGLTAVEGMAAGLPVIVTRMGGLPEVVENCVSGFVVGMGDVNAMSLHVKELHENTQLFENISDEAQTRARVIFSEKRYTDGLTGYFSG